MFKNDNEVLVALRKDRNQALRHIYETVFSSVNSYIVNNSGSMDDAKDIFQEAIIIFYQKAIKEDFQLSSTIKTFIFAVAKNLWLKRIRDGKKSKSVELNENVDLQDEKDPFDTDQKQEVGKVLVEYLDKLGDPCKKILVFYYFQKKSMEEISNELGYSNSNSAKNQKYKCLQRLKKAVPDNLRSTLQL